MHRIAVVAFDVSVAFDLGIPAQVFGSASSPGDAPRYQVGMTSATGKPVRTSAGFTAVPDHGHELLERADTVIVPGLHRSSLDLTAMEPGLDLLRSAHARGARIMSICTGAFALAAAGLLDGRPATTHWAYAERFRTQFPAVDLRPDVLFIDDGDVLTSAGVSAGMDLCLHVVRRDHGSEVANRAARRCVAPAWRDGGQSQYIDRPLPEPGDAATAATQAWVIENLERPMELDDMARHARMSVRTFTRRFREETGVSPGRWLTRQRVDHARRMLETTDLSIDEVALRSGFGTAVSMRQHLHAVVGVAPAAYRRTFRRA